MKLHLPTLLRKAVLACMASVATVTFASGTSWADTYDLLASGDAWTMTAGQAADSRTPVYHAAADGNAASITTTNWGQALAVTTAGANQMYTVGADNTLTFTMTMKSTNAGNAVTAVTLTGNTQTIALGVLGYGTSDIKYGLTSNTTADIYFHHGETQNWNSGEDYHLAGSDVVTAIGTRTTDAYTLQGVVTLGADNAYTMDLTLNGELVADDVALGESFDITRVSLEADGGENEFSNLTITGALVDIPSVTIEGNGTNDNRLINTPAAYKIILNLDGEENDYLYASGQNNTYTINNDVEIQSCIITNGNSGTTYKFTGTITGSGEFTRPSGANTGKQTYEFSGDMSAYTGAMSLLDNESNIVNRDTLIFNGNTSGTGAITTTNYNRVVVQGATMQNASITATYLEISGASSFVGEVSISTLLTLGAEQSITLGADASLTLGENALIDLANATCTEDAVGNKVYTIFAEGSEGTHNLSELSAANIKDAQLGMSYAFENGNIIATLNSKEIFYGDGTLTWNDETDNTPFTNADGESVAFGTGDIVTFNGTGTANVTLGESVAATSITVADTATVYINAAGQTLTTNMLDVDGTLNYTGSGLTAVSLSIDGKLNYNIASGEATMGGTVAGTGTLEKSGAGTLNMGNIKTSNITTDLLVSDGALKFTSEGGEQGTNTPGMIAILNKLTTTGTGKLLVSGDVVYNYTGQGENQRIVTIDDAVEVTGRWQINSWATTGNNGYRQYLLEDGADVTVGGELWLTNKQEMVVNTGAVLHANGGIKLGHNDSGSGYTARFIVNGGEVKTSGIAFRRDGNPRTGNAFIMTGGSVEFAPASATTNVIKTVNDGGDGKLVKGEVSLTGGTLVAKDSSWLMDVGSAENCHIYGVTIDTAADKTAKLAGAINFTPAEGADGTITKIGAGTLALDVTEGAVISKLSVQGGYVSSAKAITLGSLEITDGGIACDLSSVGLITAAGYSGSLTLSLSNYAAGDYAVFQGAVGLSVEDIDIVGLDERWNATASVTNGLVSINVAKSGKVVVLEWDTDGPSNDWTGANWDSNKDGVANTNFQEGDGALFAGEGEQINITGDVAPSTVTVSGTGYAFAGGGKIVGEGSLTVADGGVLEIKSAQRYTGGTTVEAGGELILSTGGASGAVKGEIDVYGTVKLNAGDATGWGNGADTITALNIMDGGVVEVTTTSNQTAAGLAVNLQGGALTGIAGSNLDLFYGGGNKYASITALAADDATADNPTVSTISGVKIGLRQRPNVFTVEENARLVIESVIWDNTAGGLNDPAGTDMTLTKAGAGELVFKGANTYNKATTVEAGALILADGGVLNASVTVKDGAIFKLAADAADVTYGGTAVTTEGTGSIIKTGGYTAYLSAVSTLGALDIQGGYVQAGSTSISTLSVANGAGFTYDLSTGEKKVVATGYDGAITLDLAVLANGTFELFQGAAGLTAEDVNFVYEESSRSQVTTSVENGLAKVTVVLSGGALDNLVWNTNGTSDVWGAGGAANWTSNGNSEQFFNGDTVTFSGTGESISIVGTVTPAGTITVDGTGYTFGGSGSIGGAAALLVANGGELTISNANTFTGGTTIAEGGQLTITNAKALSSHNGMTGATELGKVSGAGTLVIDMATESGEVAAKGTNEGASMGAFTGTVDVKRGQFYVGNVNNGTNGGAEVSFGASKVIVRADGALWTHMGGSGRVLSSNVDLVSGAELNNRDGNLSLTGNIRYNVVDPAAATPTYNQSGVVSMLQVWNKEITLSGLLEGDGTVQMKCPQLGGTGRYKITGENNTFAGTFELCDNGSSTQNLELRLGTQTAAQYADVKLNTKNSVSYLLLDSDATINGLYADAGCNGGNAVQAQGGNKTLSVNEGDYAASLLNGGNNVLSLNKVGTGTLVLRGNMGYTGTTTISGGVLEIASTATTGTTSIDIEAAGTLRVNAGTIGNAITGSGTIQKSGAGTATLSGVATDFAGTFHVAGGTLNVGSALNIGTGRTLKTGMDGATLSSALTLGGGTLAVDGSGTGEALSLNNGALTLGGGTTLSLSSVAVSEDAACIVTLFSGVGSLLGADNAALALDESSLASTYFSTIEVVGSEVDMTTLGLQLIDGKLQLIIPAQKDVLVWGEGNGTWSVDGAFEADDEAFTAETRNVEFGALTGDSDTVTISGALDVADMIVSAGEGKTYIFAAADDASGLAEVDSLVINSGTASFGAGTLDMTEGSIEVNDGGTLSLANGAIANAGAVGIVLNDGSTLQWESGNTADYSAAMDVADGAEVNLVNNSGSTITLVSTTQGEGETATFNLSGNFTLRHDTVLCGTVSMAAGNTVTLQGNDATHADNYNQSFTGEGNLAINGGHGIHLTGSNSYTGNTQLGDGCRLYIDAASALSSGTTLTGGGNVALCDTLTLAGTHTLTGETAIGSDNVTGKTVTLTGSVAGSVKVYGGNTLDLATTGVVNGINGIENNGTLMLHQAVATKVTGEGTVQVDGTGITWDNTNKSYTGETQILAGSDVTAATPISTGAGKVQLMGEDSVLTITNSTDWANKVYGAGALVLVNQVTNVDAIIDGTASDTLSTLYVGKPVATYATTDVDGRLDIDSAADAAALAKVTNVVVSAGSVLTSNQAGTAAAPIALGQNLELSGAGDAAADGDWLKAALSFHGGSATKHVSSNISLADDATIYVGNQGVWLYGQFDSNGHKLTKTGSSWLGMQGSSIDLTGGVDIQAGTLEINLAADAPTNTMGAVNMAAGTTLQLKGAYEMTGGLAVDGTATIKSKEGASVLVSSVVTGDAADKINLSHYNNGAATLTLGAANTFSGTWEVQASLWTMELAHADAVKDATVFMNASATLKLTDEVEDYNISALKSTITGAKVQTAGATRHGLIISNAQTGIVADATFAGSIAGTIDVSLVGGTQKLTGALGAGSTYAVSNGTLAIASANQTGDHSFKATGGVLDMTGYTRSADANTGLDTITVLGGQVNGLSLAANMVLSGTSDLTAAMDTITLGGNTVLGAGTMNFRVTDSTDNTNTMPGNAGTLYKETNTMYQVGADGTISLAGTGKTSLSISLADAANDVLDPTPGKGSAASYRDHVLISGISGVTLNATTGILDASDYFSMNLENIGSTRYDLLFVQNATDSDLVDLVLRAAGAADTLFWGNAAGGAWNTSEGNNDWVAANLSGDAPVATTTPADFEQYDHVIFDDLAGASAVTVTAQTAADGAALQVGSIIVQSDTTNYTIKGNISSAEGNLGATLTKTGTSTLTLTGANSYAGETTISGGTIVAQNEAALSNTLVHVDGTTLVLDYATGGEFDATVQLDSYSGRDFSTLRALQDAEANVKFVGSRDKRLQAAAGSTLTINLAADAVNGALQVNDAEGMTGKVVMDLAANKTHAHNAGISVSQGELALKGAANTTWNSTGALAIKSGATVRVQDGMTLKVDSLEGISNTYGALVLEDASKLVLTDTDTANRTIGVAITSEGATLTAQNTNAVLTLKSLTLAGADDTTLSGGTWVLQKDSTTWKSGAKGALAIASATTLKVNDDTLKSLKLTSTSSTLTTSKTGDAKSLLNVETIQSVGAITKVDLKLTGAGSSISGTAGDVTVAQTGKLSTTPELTLGGATTTTMGALTVQRGTVAVAANSAGILLGAPIAVVGTDAKLDMSGLNALKNSADATVANVVMNAGALANAGAYTGLVEIDDNGVALDKGITLGGLTSAAQVKLTDIETETGVTTLKGMQSMTLAAGSAITLTDKLEDGTGNMLFQFADATGTLQMAEGATLSIDVNSVLGDVLDSTEGGVTYSLANADITALEGKVVYDAVLSLFNITTQYTTDGKLVLDQTETPLSADSIYRSSEDNVGDAWAGNGANVYASADDYASVYIDTDTTIDLTDAAPDAVHAENGMVLSNLIGRGNGADLTIIGDGDDLVTINNNLQPDELGNSLKSISFNGNIDVTDTVLQIKNTVATPGAADAGELDPGSVYQINGNLTTDANSDVVVTAGVLKLNGKNNELLGGVTVEDSYGQLQISGNAAVGGALQLGNSLSEGNNCEDDVQLLSGGKLTLLDGAAITEGLDIMGAGQGKETLSVAKDAVATLSGGADVQDVMLDLKEGATLQLLDGAAASAMELDGLTGAGALVNDVDNGGQSGAEITIRPGVNSVFSGDLSAYEGSISVLRNSGGTATQTFSQVTTAAAGDSMLDLCLNGDTIINVAEENGNKTLNLRDLEMQRDAVTTFEVNTDALVAGGAPALTVGGDATVASAAEMVLSSSSSTVLSATDDMLLATAVAGGDVSDMDGMSITLDTTDNAFRKLSAHATLSVENGNVYVNTSASEVNRYAYAASAPNALAGAELLWPVAPAELPKDSALKAVDQAVADLLKGGKTGEAERVLAAAAGASTAVLGSALSGDVERQLRAIRNRTTTMGVNQCEVNDGMPYVNAWISAEGDHREMAADGLAAGYTLDSWGGTVGFDVDINNNLTMGMAVTAMYGDLTGDGPETAEGDFDTQYVSFFARVADRAWTHTFVATVGRADASLTRTVNYGSGSYETEGSTNGTAYGFMYEVARTFALSEDGSTCWQPVFNVAWRHSSIDAYAESGCDAALGVGEQEMNVLTFGLGARLQSVIGENLYNRASIFEARALVKVDAGDREGEADVALLGGTTSATVTSAEVGAVGVELGAGVTVPVGMSAGAIFIDASAELRSGYTNVNGTVGYRINF